MKRAYRIKYNMPQPVKKYQGESIEGKIARIVENKEPITDGAPIIYTEKKDGVLPQFDIRTDRWDIALEAMDKVNQANIAKSKEYLKKEVEKKGEEMDKKGGDPEQN